jgi:hypothetical protein
VPTWLQTAKADFVCNNCPNRQTKNIAFLTLETAAPAVEKVDEEVEEVAAEEEADL